MDTDDTRNPNVNGARASERDWQWLWFSTLQRRPWSSLAVVPGDGDVEAGRVAEALVAVGRLYGERPVQLLNAEGVGLGDVEKLLDARDRCHKAVREFWKRRVADNDQPCNAMLHDGKVDWLVYHAYDAVANGTPKLRIEKLEWDSAGWPHAPSMESGIPP